MMKKMLCGLMIVLLGVVFLLHNLEILPYSFEIFKYWPVFVMLIGLGDIFDRGKVQLDSIILIAVGGVFLLCNFDLFDFDLVWKLFFPAMIILIGLAIMFPKYKSNKELAEVIHDKSDVTHVSGIFANTNSKNTSKGFSKGNVNAVFGGATLNLTDAEFDEKAVCQVTAIFGGADLILPEDVIVNTDGLTCIFGGFDDYRSKTKRKKKDDDEESESTTKKKKTTDKKKVLYLVGTVIFGGVDIK